MTARYGFVPLSVLEITRGKLSASMHLFQRETPTRNPMNAKVVAKHDRMKEAGYRPKTSASQKRCGRGTQGLSTMPAELVQFFAKYYARKGQTYLDPFMGQGVQMQVAKRLGMHYYGYDISEEFCRYIEAVCEKIYDGSTIINVTCGDSRNPENVPDGMGDFCFTSPPYWDIEFYGEEPGQLGYKRSYQDFLKGMEDVARAWLPKFRRGAWCVVNVNDFRKDAKYYAYHADTIALYQRAGWELCDTWIIRGLVGGLPKAFAVSWNLRRIAPKVHEYALCFRRP